MILWPGYVVRVRKYRGWGSARCCSCGIKGKQSLYIPWLWWSPHRGEMLFSSSFNICLFFGDKLGCGQGQSPKTHFWGLCYFLHDTMEECGSSNHLHLFSQKNIAYHKRHRLTKKPLWGLPVNYHSIFYPYWSCQWTRREKFHENKVIWIPDYFTQNIASALQIKNNNKTTGIEILCPAQVLLKSEEGQLWQYYFPRYKQVL